MSFRPLSEVFQLFWSPIQIWQQILVWQDADKARKDKRRAEAKAAQQLQAMRDANPSGQLGDARLNDPQSLEESGLL